jgi:hypothetical protein
MEKSKSGNIVPVPIVKLASHNPDEMIAEIRLLTLREMEELFPDCEILRERFLGIFTKSYIAFRPAPVRMERDQAAETEQVSETSGLEPATARTSLLRLI